MTTTPTPSPELPDLARLEALARAADQGEGQHIYTNPRDSNGWQANEAWHRAASPAAVLAMIALARRAQPEGDMGYPIPVSKPEGEAPQADESSEPLDVEFKQLADTILQATTNGTRLEALRGMAALFDKQSAQNAPAATLSPLCGAQHAESGKEAAVFANDGTEPDWSSYAAAEVAQQAAAPTHCDPAEGFCAKCRADERAAQQAAAPGNSPVIPDGSTSAPGTPEAPKKPAHGHRDDYYLLANGRRLGLEPISRVRNMPNWVLAMELFATGSTSAHQICHDAGIDPDSTTIQRAAQLDGDRGEGQ